MLRGGDSSPCRAAPQRLTLIVREAEAHPRVAFGMGRKLHPVARNDLPQPYRRFGRLGEARHARLRPIDETRGPAIPQPFRRLPRRREPVVLGPRIALHRAFGHQRLQQVKTTRGAEPDETADIRKCEGARIRKQTKDGKGLGNGADRTGHGAKVFSL